MVDSKGMGVTIPTERSWLEREDDMVDKLDEVSIDLIASRQLDLDTAQIVAGIPVALGEDALVEGREEQEMLLMVLASVIGRAHASIQPICSGCQLLIQTNACQEDEIPICLGHGVFSGHVSVVTVLPSAMTLTHHLYVVPGAYPAAFCSPRIDSGLVQEWTETWNGALVGKAGTKQVRIGVGGPIGSCWRWQDVRNSRSGTCSRCGKSRTSQSW
jgi:hypothetical protein